MNILSHPYFPISLAVCTVVLTGYDAIVTYDHKSRVMAIAGVAGSAMALLKGGMEMYLLGGNSAPHPLKILANHCFSLCQLAAIAFRLLPQSFRQMVQKTYKTFLTGNVKANSLINVEFFLSDQFIGGFSFGYSVVHLAFEGSRFLKSQRI